MTMLSGQIETAQRSVRTDAYQMSIGELVSMYEEGELIVDPEFQRLFRWEAGQKSKLIESLLLGIPLPSIFVFEKEDGKWELVDGLQRLSTILEFMGKLQEPTGELRQPSVLEATRYLPALHNVVWQKSDQISELPEDQQNALDRVEQLSIRRARLGVEILKRPSDEATKFDLFQRLNAGGTEANAQEVRNSIVLMVNANYFRAIRDAAENPIFKRVSGVSEDQEQKQRHVELAMRFLVHTFISYDGRLDVEEYIDEGSITLAREGNSQRDTTTIERTFSLLDQAAGSDALRRFSNGRHSGKIGLVALEVIAVGVGKNLDAILQTSDPVAFVRARIIGFWEQPGLSTYTSGMRGTTRIQRTVPSGADWFRP